METGMKELIEKNEVAALLAYKDINGTIYPHAFTKEDISTIAPWKVSDARYPILKMLLAVTRANPGKRYGILLRGCEERGLRELVKWEQIDPDMVVVIGQACSKELAIKCVCAKPYPDALRYGEAVEGVKQNKALTELREKDRGERLSWWLSQFNRCLKCYGCRDVCPVCFCTDCSLEHKNLLVQGILPPDTSFHLVRAVHMAGRCIDCGLCEETCPARIPLRSLYKEVNEIVNDVFSYETGSLDTKSPFSMIGDEALLPFQANP